MEPARASNVALPTVVFQDGIGERRRVSDATGEDTVELLCLRRELTAIPSFEFALRERASTLANFRHTYFGRVRSVDRLNDPSATLALASESTRGIRLSHLLTPNERRPVTVEINAALHLLRQIVSAVAMLHETDADIAHGAIGPERIVVTPNARVVIVEYVLGAALEQLRYTGDRYWRELRIALPPSPDAAKFDQRADVTQLGVVGLSLVLGRLLTDDEYPRHLHELLSSAAAISSQGGVEPLPPGLRTWLARALQLDPRHAFATAVEANEELDRVLSGEEEIVDAELPSAPAAAVAGEDEDEEEDKGEELEVSLDDEDEHEYLLVNSPELTGEVPADVDLSGIAAAPVAQYDPHLDLDEEDATLPAATATALPVAPVMLPVAAASMPSPVATAPLVAPVVIPVAVAPPVVAAAPMPAPVTRPPSSSSIPVPVAAKPTVHAPVLPSPPVAALHAEEEEGEPLMAKSSPSARQTTRIAAAAVAILALSVGGAYGARRYLSPASAAVTTGQLSVSSTPAGAAVVVDGKPEGVTPVVLTLSPGSHLVELRGAGEPRMLPITMTAGAQMSQYVELPGGAAPKLGQLLVRTEPAGAQVTVDGVARGKSPLTIADLTPGQHAVLLESDLGTVHQTVAIEAATTASLVVPLGGAAEGAPVSGWISISAPVDLQIFENKRLLGTSQTDRIMVAAGRHDIEIVNEPLGYRVVKTVQVAPGKIAPIKLDWPKGTIAINAVPWAEVWIDGEKAGETPIGNLSLAIGPHEIVFRHPDLGEQRHAATVTVGTPARLSVDLRKKP